MQTCRLGLETAQKIGDLGFQSRLYANLAVAYCALTQRCDDDGLRAAQSAIDLDRQLGQIDHLAVPLIVLGQIHQCHGEFDKALRYYEEARGLAEEMGEPQLLFPCYEGLATVYLDQGDDARAEQYFIRADEVCAQGRGRPRLAGRAAVPVLRTAISGRGAWRRRCSSAGVGKVPMPFGPSAASICVQATLPSASTRKCPASCAMCAARIA